MPARKNLAINGEVVNLGRCKCTTSSTHALHYGSSVFEGMYVPTQQTDGPADFSPASAHTRPLVSEL